MSDADKAKMARVARSLREAESDELVTGAELAGTVRWANQRRAERGIEPLELNDDDDPPELEMYRRARALGMARLRR